MEAYTSEPHHMTPGSRLSPHRPPHRQRPWVVPNGYWARDYWDARDPFFDEFERPAHPWRRRSGVRVNFTGLPEGIRDEAKCYFAHQLQHRRLRLSTVFAYGSTWRLLATFLSERYPTLTTLTTLSFPEVAAQFRQFIARTGRTTHHHAPHVFRQLLRFVAAESARMDAIERGQNPDESAFHGDQWDVRTIPGARFSHSGAAYLLSFVDIPVPFRASVKHYLRFRVSHGISQAQCYADIRALGFFYTFVHARHPTWTDVVALTRADVEAFLASFREGWARRHATSPTRGTRRYLKALRQYLAYLERAQRPEAPATPLALLWWREDIPPEPKSNDTAIRYIPDGVLQQLEAALEQLSPAEYIPMVILLRASGWRISHVLNLRYESCLERTGLGWYLCGDIVKTQVLNHHIPITDEVAAVVQAVVEETKAYSTPETNPEHLLFVRVDGTRRGRPPMGSSVALALNRLAARARIVDDQGALFRFGNHAFRHTKAVELINNGMSLLHVQKWLAHYSPEMTLRYARILDETLRQAWVEATQGGLFRLDGVGGMRRVELGDVADEDLVEWAYIRTHLDAVRMPHGYCFKPLKQPCPAQEQPCLSCRNLCTTTEFLPEFERQIAGTRVLIAEGAARGRVIWVQKNEALLGRLEGVSQVLRDHRTHHTAGKRGREYVGHEREGGQGVQGLGQP